MNKRVGIFGASGMALETRDIAHDLGLSVVFVVRDSTELAAFGDSGDCMLETDIDRFRDIPYIIGIGEGSVRRKIAARYAKKVKFLNLIHPSATFGRGQRDQLECRQGVIVCAGVRMTTNISIGNFTIFNLNSTVSHDSIIGDFTTVAPQACILGNVDVKNGAWIGAGAIINQGVNETKLTIGANSILGSGTVILHDCDADSIYVGVPARKIK